MLIQLFNREEKGRAYHIINLHSCLHEARRWLAKKSLFLFCFEVSCWAVHGSTKYFTLLQIELQLAYILLQAQEVDLFFCFLYRHNEAYTWTNPTCCVHNVIIGKLWLEQYGTVEIVNHR